MPHSIGQNSLREIIVKCYIQHLDKVVFTMELGLFLFALASGKTQSRGEGFTTTSRPFPEAFPNTSRSGAEAFPNNSRRNCFLYSLFTAQYVSYTCLQLKLFLLPRFRRLILLVHGDPSAPIYFISINILPYSLLQLPRLSRP